MQYDLYAGLFNLGYSYIVEDIVYVFIKDIDLQFSFLIVPWLAMVLGK
jgi:hypothetical protein